MSTSARKTGSTDARDAALAAIAQAIEELSRPDERRSPPENPEAGQTGAAGSLSVEPDVVSPGRRLAFGRAAVWILLGLIAIIFAGVIILAWPISDSRTPKSSAVPLESATAAVAAAVKNEPVTTQAILSVVATRIDKSLEQPAVQPQIAPAEPVVSVPSEMTQRIEALERRLTNPEQGIEQIKADQARLARESSEHLGFLREMQQKLILRVQEFDSAVKAAEEKAAQDRLTAAEQFRANQEQLARIGEQLKANQEQIDRQKGVTQRRVARLGLSQPQPPDAPAMRKPAPKPRSPQVGVSPSQSSRQSRPDSAN